MNNKRQGWLLATTAVGVALMGAGSAWAQAANTGNQLEEVVVTATRQADTVNRVPLSISAVTQRNLDQQGIKTAQDLTRVVPALNLVNQTAGVATFAIRGIVATTGAATTGVYLDDTALTKRNNAGVSQNNGAPLPTLFDLERVEVLKGPQGTLYGGSSQGGTIRFITPTPSLTRYSGLARAEVNQVQNGETGYEVGLAAGGPIIQDKLGFRVSGIKRSTGGWIDVRNPYQNGALVLKDGNSSAEWATRLALTAALTENFRATLAWYRSDFWNEGGGNGTTGIYAPNGQRAPAGQTYTTPVQCFNNSTRTPTTATAPAAVACPTGPLPTGWYQRPSQTYGPFDYLGKYDTLTPFDGVIREGRTLTSVGSLTLEWDTPNVMVKSITSLVHDRTIGDNGESQDPGRVQTTLENPGKTSFPLFRPVVDYAGRFQSRNKRWGIEHELRLSSPSDQRPVNWVAGIFFSNLRTHIQYVISGNYDRSQQALFGLTATQRYSIPNPGGFVSVLDASLRDTEVAGFGEVNAWVTKKLKVTGGLRLSRVSLDFTQANYGQLSARADVNAPFAYVAGNGANSPITPKIGVQYQINDDSMVYANASKGFRAGGVNVPLNPQVCSAGLALFGLTVNDIPVAYGPDTVWSYEGGAKLRMLNNSLQVNGAVYRIDWTDIQVTTSAQGCGQNWNQNGGQARSQGFDLQFDYRPVRALTLNGSVGYTDAKYSQDVLGPKPLTGNAAVTFFKGDPLGVPKWQFNVGARFDADLGAVPAYLRVDYQYTGKYTQGSSFGTGNYNPFTRNVDANDQVNMRVGVTLKGWDVNVYANNLLNGYDKLGNSGNGQSGCNAATGGATCSVYSLWTPFVTQSYQKPRMFGAQANYRF